MCNRSYKNKRALQRHIRYAHSGKDNHAYPVKNNPPLHQAAVSPSSTLSTKTSSTLLPGAPPPSTTPPSGSLGGGTILAITGTGFDSVDGVAITVCDNVCESVSVTTSQIECLTTANDSEKATEVCDVIVTQATGSRRSKSRGRSAAREEKQVDELTKAQDELKKDLEVSENDKTVLKDTLEATE